MHPSSPAPSPTAKNRPAGAQMLYHTVAAQCAQLITEQYSTSFSRGISTLHPRYRAAIYSIYGFVRLADEIVDTFHEADKRRHLEAFRRDTWLAIEDGLSLNPVLDAYQGVVNAYNLPQELTKAFLYSMELDLDPQTYDPTLYNKYIYGSAEVVGLMCLCVFCEGDLLMYQNLTPQARALGAAFQKVNFLRDIQSDLEDRGRVYFPNVDLTKFTPQAKAQIEADIAQDFAHGLKGIKALPPGTRLGVYLAYTYYQQLFVKIQRTPPERILQTRIRVPDAQKMWLLLQSYVRHRLQLL